METAKSTCPYCNLVLPRMIQHVKQDHPLEYEAQEELVKSLSKKGISSRKIIEHEDVVIFKGGTSIRRVLNKFFTSEEMEENRKNMIGKASKEAYAAGERDWVTDINIARVTSDEGRQKNSEGVKKAYEEGRKVSWTKGQTAATNIVIRNSGRKTSKTLKAMIKAGGLTSQFKPGKDSPNWKGGISEQNLKERATKLFSKGKRQELLAAADYACELCGKQHIDLEFEKTEFDIVRWGLECDHINPVHKGGGNELSNGQVLCTECHVEKTIVERGQNPENALKKNALLNSHIATKVLGTDVTIYDLASKHEPGYILTLGALVFYSDEWRRKRKICESLVNEQMGKSSTVLQGDECELRKVKTADEIEFLNTNHISGYVESLFAWGLYLGSDLVYLLSFREPVVYFEDGFIEIARHCFKNDVKIVGGFDKLVQHARFELRGHYSHFAFLDNMRFGDELRSSGSFLSFTDYVAPTIACTDGFTRQKGSCCQNKRHEVCGRGLSVYALSTQENGY